MQKMKQSTYRKSLNQAFEKIDLPKLQSNALYLAIFTQGELCIDDHNNVVLTQLQIVLTQLSQSYTISHPELKNAIDMIEHQICEVPLNEFTIEEDIYQQVY